MNDPLLTLGVPIVVPLRDARLPKVGDTVWYYFEHAFWDEPLPDYHRGEPLPDYHQIAFYRGDVVVKRWRWTGRTELRARPARVVGPELTPAGYLQTAATLVPEYASDDRVRKYIAGVGIFAALADKRPKAYLHGRHENDVSAWGRIVDGILPAPYSWGFDPLPPLVGGGR